MLLEEFNKTVSKHKIKAPEDTPVSILREADGEVLIEILGKKVWVEKRLTNLYIPERKREEFEPQSSLDLEDFQLPSGPFKLLTWIKSLERHVFSGKHAERSIGMASRTVRDNLKYLEQSGKIKVKHIVGRGYEVILRGNNEKATLLS